MQEQETEASRGCRREKGRPKQQKKKRRHTRHARARNEGLQRLQKRKGPTKPAAHKGTKSKVCQRNERLEQQYTHNNAYFMSSEQQHVIISLCHVPQTYHKPNNLKRINFQGSIPVIEKNDYKRVCICGNPTSVQFYLHCCDIAILQNCKLQWQWCHKLNICHTL